ncbi:MAG: OmpA family protein [Rhabdochlamydiaceae bacterium]|nr:OmpA family protein [Candidatus Amphrikana amoebophyrae]
MKIKQICSILILAILTAGCTSANNAANTAWQSTKTFGQYLSAKGQALMGKSPAESKAIYSQDEIITSADDDFIPLLDEDLKPQYAEVIAPQPTSKNELHIEKFKNPTQELAAIFKIVHFNTDDDKIRVKEYSMTVDRIASYLKSHSELFVFVEGHCDDRASESYNLALGSRRANTVRNQLIRSGVNPDQIYTISYGKERLIAKGTTRVARAKNRRVEFKIFDSQARY